MTRPIKAILIAAMVFMPYACSKEARLKEDIIGTWASIDHIDTLDFINDEVFKKNFYDGLMHTYTYEIRRDSIKIQYSGPNAILTLPSTHHVELLDDNLAINFSNGTYGIRKMDIVFSRID